MTCLERTRPLVLVVDHEPLMLDEIAAALTRMGLGCRCCTTAADALTLAEDLLPDLILAEVNLHGESGLEMCQRIRENHQLADVPAMFLSSNQGPDIIRRSDGHHGTYYLRKPFAAEVLVELIDRALTVGSGAARIPPEPDRSARPVSGDHHVHSNSRTAHDQEMSPL
jgi:DNA-binding response OmpR family regulator